MAFLVDLLGLPHGSPFNRAAAIMVIAATVAAVGSLASVAIKLTRDRRVMALLRRAEESDRRAAENDRNTREVLALLKERIIQTVEHRADAKQTLKAVVKEAEETREAVDRKGERIVHAVERIAQAPSPTPPEGTPPFAAGT